MDIDKFIAQAHFQAANWDMELKSPDASFFDTLSCYIYDVDRKRLDLVSINEEGFYRADEVSRDVEAGDVAHEVIKLSDHYFKGRRTGAFLNKFGATICLYMTSTLSWREAKRRADLHLHSGTKPHLFLTIYKSKKTISKRIVRPFIILSDKRLIDAPEVLETVYNTMEYDRVKNAHWFR